MADKNGKAETPAAPAFVSRPMSAIPKRATPTNSVDLDKANTLLGLVFADGAIRMDGENVLTASDGAAYTDKVKARTAANAAKRLLSHVKPDGFNTVTRVYQPEGTEGDGGWEWALWLEPVKDAATAK